MLDFIKNINSVVNNFVWGVPAMVCIIGVGLYMSIRTGFVQIRKFGYSMRNTIGRIFEKQTASEGSITPFQAVCTALAATVGTGNIAGVAGAIAIGGPGAVFWMWLSALLGMCTKFAEVTLAVHFREKNDKGDYVGGPMYYIRLALKHMLEKQSGSIITVSSAMGLRCASGAAYVTSKAGVIGLTRNVAFRGAEAHVRANCICPGHVETPMAKAATRNIKRVVGGN